VLVCFIAVEFRNVGIAGVGHVAIAH